MAAENLLGAPRAELNSGQSELYTPSILAFSGRLGRLRYLAYSMGSYLLLMLVMVPMFGASAFMGGDPDISTIGMLVMAVVYIALIVVWIMFAKRRLNDLDRNGWWLLLTFVPFANFLLTIYMIFFPGTDGDNNYGAVPIANTLGVQILGWIMPVMMILGVVAAVLAPQFAAMST